MTSPAWFFISQQTKTTAAAATVTATIMQQHRRFREVRISLLALHSPPLSDLKLHITQVRFVAIPPPSRVCVCFAWMLFCTVFERV